MDTYAILRSVTYNGMTIEKDRLIKNVRGSNEADIIIEKYQDEVSHAISLKGFSFTFYHRKILTDATNE